MDQLDLSPFFKTKLEANNFASHLSAVSDSIYQTGFDLEKALTEQFSMKKKDLFMAMLQDNKVAVDSTSDLKAFFDKLLQKVAAMPVLSLTIAFEPTEQTLQVLTDWFLLNIQKQVLFDISVDPNLVAGATIDFNGRHLDMSVKTKFSEILNNTMNPAKKNQTQSPSPQPATHQSAAHMHLGR